MSQNSLLQKEKQPRTQRGNCRGMELFTDDIVRGLLSKSLKTATVDENGWRNVEEKGGTDEAKFVSFLTFTNLANSVTENVSRIKNHPLVANDIPVYGYIRCKERAID